MATMRARTWWPAFGLVLMVGCIPGGGGGGSGDGGVFFFGDGGPGGRGDGGPVGDGGLVGDGGVTGRDGGGFRPPFRRDGGVSCMPNCNDRACGSDGCGGTCGECGDDQRCTGGECSDEPCPEGTNDCGGVCSILGEDPDNCGLCGRACPRDEGRIAECLNAECYLTCPGSRGLGLTIDLNSDPNNCGRCGNRCPSIGGQAPQCDAGTCVDPCAEMGQVGCGDACVDTQFDPFNCGDCGRVCPTANNGSPVCEFGECGDPCGGDAMCNGTCVDTDNDVANCGRCGNRCPDTQTCQGGQCVCPGAGQVNLQTNADHCGECGNSCPVIANGERECRNGACADACGGNLNECDGACVDLQSDAQNCGRCGTDCGDFQTRLPDVRFWLSEIDAGVGSFDCQTGSCLFAVTRLYSFPTQALHLTSCETICAEAGMVCSPEAVIEACTYPDGDVALGDAGAGCAIFQGINTADATAFGCQDDIPPVQGLGGSDRVAINCFCVGQNPPVPAPGLGGTVPAPGSYQYDLSDDERMIIRVELPVAGEVVVAFENEGSAVIVDGDGEEFARESDLNFGFVIGTELPAGTYYVVYRNAFGDPERIVFEILF